MNGEVYFDLITPMPEVDDAELTEALAPLQARLGKVLLEEAKRLSINGRFQDDVRRLRQEWSITVPGDTPPLSDLEEIVSSYWQQLSNSEVSQLKHAIRTLMIPYGLDPLRHWGLALGAVFYGITPATVINHWDRIERLAIKGSPGVLQIDDLMQPDRERLALLAVIKWLWFYVTQKERSLSFPEPVHKIIEEAVSMTNGPEEWGDLEKLGEYIQRILAASPTPALLIPVNEYTTVADVKRTWPLVEQCKAVFMDGAMRERGEWTTYARDVEMMTLFDEYGNYLAVIREYHRRHPEERLIPAGIISDDVQDKVRQVIHRARDRSL